MTSEGVFVFLDEALRNRGIDPKSGQTFTLKLTGVRETRIGRGAAVISNGRGRNG